VNNFVFTDVIWVVIYTAIYGWQSVVSTMSDWCQSDIVMGIRTVSAPVAQLNRQAIGNIAEGPPL
jgi:hypothetical protein